MCHNGAMSLLMIIVTALLGSALCVGQWVAQRPAEVKAIQKISIEKLADKMPAIAILTKSPEEIQAFVRDQSQPKSPDFGEVKNIVERFLTEFAQYAPKSPMADSKEIRRPQ